MIIFLFFGGLDPAVQCVRQFQTESRVLRFSRSAAAEKQKGKWSDRQWLLYAGNP
jgi:hypothetical protein